MQVRFDPTTLRTMKTLCVPLSWSVSLMFVSVAFRPMWLKRTPSQSVVWPEMVRFPPIVLFLIDPRNHLRATAGERDVAVHGDPVQPHGLPAGHRDVPADGDGGVHVPLDGAGVGRVACVGGWLAAQADHGTRAAGDVASDRDRRRCALRVEHGARGDVDVADDVDHSVGDHGTLARDGEAGKGPRGDLTAGTCVRRRAGRGGVRRPT